MNKSTISAYLRDHLENFSRKQDPGPYLVISRQYGCEDVELGQYLIEKLNLRNPEKPWKVYCKELLKQLAEETGMPQEIIEREQYAKPNVLKDFLRGLTKGSIPDGFEIYKKVALIVRSIAFEGYSIIIGQGSGMGVVTLGIENGLSVRIEAPKDWRVAHVSIYEKIDKSAAEAKIEENDRQWKLIRRLYEEKNLREPAFALFFDNSIFNREQIGELILRAMEQKGLIAPPTAQISASGI